MMTLREVFQLPGQQQSLTEGVLRGEWFPELHLDWIEDSVLQQMQQDGRLRVDELGYESSDGYRYAALYTVWFDGQPLLIVQQAGRSGRDHLRRWVVDGPRYAQLLGYVFQLLPQDPGTDLASLDDTVYPEAVLQFYGQDFASRFGIAIEPKRATVMLLRNERELLAQEPHDHVLVLLKQGAALPGEYIRRGEAVLQHVKTLDREQVGAQNERMVQVNDETGVDRVAVYRPAARPEGVDVVPV